MNLFVMGYGYSASYYVRTRRTAYDHIGATARSRAKRDAMADEGLDPYALSPEELDATLPAALASTDRLLVSIPPASTGVSS